ncbi:hypothetical protein AaE_002030 [Aphanomyces astaci]|uniref:Ribonuclease n=1 Tax=Aphanomyces astaci TaxID=112090 RepID=A0A6A5AVH8_APHAT|nr:hypothetical protein AaE_002030 [Aphanomyces astaci]
MMRATSSAAPLRRSARLLSATTPSKTPSILKEVKNATTVVRASTKKPRAAPVLSKSKTVTATQAGEVAPVTFKRGTLSREFEQRIYKKGFSCVVGVDEAGRGPLAGPVVAAACCIPLDIEIDGIHDSKQLNEAQRDLLFEKLTTHPGIQYAVHVRIPSERDFILTKKNIPMQVNSHTRIDEINVLQATLESMTKSVEALTVQADYALIDGNKMPPLSIQGECVIKGDSKVYAIAAASIIAKVTRDRLMVVYDKQWPEYGFAQHKGYGTRMHMAAIHKHGATPIHRMTFAPLNQLE